MFLNLTHVYCTLMNWVELLQSDIITFRFKTIYGWYILDEPQQIRTGAWQNAVITVMLIWTNGMSARQREERQKGGVCFQRYTCGDWSEWNELLGSVWAQQRMMGGPRASTGPVGWTRSRSCDWERQGSRTRPPWRYWCRGRPPRPRSPTAGWSGGPPSPPWSSQRTSCRPIREHGVSFTVARC